MYKRIVIIISVFAVAVTAFSQQPFPDSIRVGLAGYIDEFKNEVHSPGIAVIIFQDTSIVFSHASGFMDREQQVAVSIDSKFPIMSVTKMFTATLLMQMVEQKKLRLEDPVKKYVPEYHVRGIDGQEAQTTLVQLATHTSGLPRNTPAQIKFSETFDRWMLGDVDSNTAFILPSNKEMLQSLRHVQIEYPPYDFIHHNDRHYSNLGYSLLGLAVERASKMDYTQLVSRNITGPLQMNHTGVLSNSIDDKSVAAGYRWDTLKKALQYVPIFRPGSAIYAGGLYSTARDLFRFTSAHSSDGYTILSPANRNLMRSQKIGWKPAYPYVLHEGAMPGYRSIIVMNPVTKIGWVMLLNVQDVDFNRINDRLAKISSKVLEKKIAVEKEKFAGSYSIAGGYATLKITLRNDTLFSTYLDDVLGGTPMIQEGNLVFTVKGKTGHSIRYEFVIGKNGKVNAVKMGQYVWDREK